VVLDVATGEVLAMVNLPCYQPHRASRPACSTPTEPRVIDLIVPGSTIKR
jgi:cell division protein FtsI (penicillin-binding protein 3)